MKSLILPWLPSLFCWCFLLVPVRPGNAAYETADHIVSSTNLIHMVARYVSLDNACLVQSVFLLVLFSCIFSLVLGEVIVLKLQSKGVDMFLHYLECAE